jgi:hypothetical protein
MSAVPNQISPHLVIQPQPGTFTTKNNKGRPVNVKQVLLPFHKFRALIYKTSLNADFDGAPNCYSSPESVTNLDRRFGAADHINNATNQVPPHFNANGVNTFEWKGVVNRPSPNPPQANSLVDDRLFLQDRNHTFPVFQDATKRFYVSTTALAADLNVPETNQKHWVNAAAIPYGVRAGLAQAGVGLGDFGLAIRSATGAHTGFIIADAGGGGSVGEYSQKLIQTLFPGGAGNSEACFIVFPGSRTGGRVTVSSIEANVSTQVAKLSEVVNTYEIAREFSFPFNWRLGGETLTRTLVQNPQMRIEHDNIMKALREKGYAPNYLIDL